jgi:hypothetical protein
VGGAGCRGGLSAEVTAVAAFGPSDISASGRHDDCPHDLAEALADMLKIAATEAGTGTAVLHLEGQVIGPWVRELERVCGPYVARGALLDLDLSAVRYVSREGLELLARLAGNGARLVNCTPFVAEQLRTMPGGPGAEEVAR